MGELNLADLAAQIREFTRAPDWDQFHSPKNLSMALAAETGELLDIFRWLTEAESRDLPFRELEAAADELVDVLWFVVRLFDVLGIDPEEAWGRKVEANALRYDADEVRGSAEKR